MFFIDSPAQMALVILLVLIAVILFVFILRLITNRTSQAPTDMSQNELDSFWDNAVHNHQHVSNPRYSIKEAKKRGYVPRNFRAR